MTISVIKREGKINFDDISSKLQLLLNTSPNGEYNLTLTRKRTKRTVDQNALMWLWFSCIENETGTDKQDIHDYCCRAFNYRIVNINGEQQKVAGGTSKLNTAQMANFLNQVQVWAATELGIILPNPEDKEFENFQNYYKQFNF